MYKPQTSPTLNHKPQPHIQNMQISENVHYTDQSMSITGTNKMINWVRIRKRLLLLNMVAVVKLLYVIVALHRGHGSGEIKEAVVDYGNHCFVVPSDYRHQMSWTLINGDIEEATVHHRFNDAEQCLRHDVVSN